MLKAEAETEAEGRALRPMDETDFAAGARMAAILAAVKARESGLAD
jgi:hypothetical protein